MDRRRIELRSPENHTNHGSPTGSLYGYIEAANRIGRSINYDYNPILLEPIWKANRWVFGSIGWLRAQEGVNHYCPWLRKDQNQQCSLSLLFGA